MSIQTYETYDELVETLKKADDLYYNDPDNATLPDAEYDALYDHLTTLEAESPEIIRADSPTQRLVPVGTLFDKTRHQRPMLSLEKVTEVDDLEKFVVNIGIENTFEVSAKVDGMALNLDYDEKGRLIRAVSRGDGTIGENLTTNALQVIGIPTKLPDVEEACSVRGEVVIPVEKFELIKDQFANPRNAAAGGMRGTDPAEAKKRHLHFLAYDLASEDTTIKSSAEAAVWLQNKGFSIPATTFVKGAVKVAQAVDELFELKDSLAYETDGVVIKAAQYSVRDAFENRTKSPRWAVAFKRAGETAHSVLQAVSWQVAKTGIISPVAELRPTSLSGVTISRATLHNMKYVDDMGLGIHDTVEITRAGDIIPRVLRVVSKSPMSVKIAPPTSCPSCNSNVTIYSESKIAKCDNTIDCPEQIKGKLVAWASRKAGNIDAIGETWIDTLVDAGVLTRPSGFYKLTTRHLFGFDRMGTTLADKFVDSINASRNIGLRRALIGFSIPFASEGTSRRLCQVFDSIESVAAARASDFTAIEDIGETVAKSLVDFFSQPENLEEIAALRQLGVNLDRLPEDAPVVVDANSPFAGKKVCITGTLTESRGHYQSLLEAAGAKVSSSVSKNTDFLLAGEKAGSKLTKAQEYGTVVLSEDDLMKMLEG